MIVLNVVIKWYFRLVVVVKFMCLGSVIKFMLVWLIVVYLVNEF